MTSGEQPALPRQLAQRLTSRPGWQTFKEVLYGMFLHDSVRTLQRQRSELENIFVLTIFGDIVGVPILPPYYSLRLVPYLAGSVSAWKRRVLRERQPFESEEYDLHGV